MYADIGAGKIGEEQTKRVDLLSRRSVDKHDVEGFGEESRSQIFAMHPKAIRLALSERYPTVFLQLSVDDQRWEVEEADCHCGSRHVEEILRQSQLVHKELELKEVLAGLS